MAGFRSPLPLLGLATAESETQAGYRSLLGIWSGGAAAQPVAVQAGYRGLMGFWLGGASTTEEAPPPPRLLLLPRMYVRDPWDEEDEALFLGGALN